MTDELTLLEDARIAAGLTQAALARALGVTQPHYSKVAGRIVAPGPALAARISDWLDGRPAAPPAERSAPDEILELSRAIERQSRRLGVLLSVSGLAPARRPLRRSGRR